MPSDPNTFVELFIFDLAGVDLFQEYLSKYVSC